MAQLDYQNGSDDVAKESDRTRIMEPADKIRRVVGHYWLHLQLPGSRNPGEFRVSFVRLPGHW